MLERVTGLFARKLPDSFFNRIWERVCQYQNPQLTELTKQSQLDPRMYSFVFYYLLRQQALTAIDALSPYRPDQKQRRFAIERVNKTTDGLIANHAASLFGENYRENESAQETLSLSKEAANLIFILENHQPDPLGRHPVDLQYRFAGIAEKLNQLAASLDADLTAKLNIRRKPA